ncbi:hypothetical protein EJ04DRAFT_28762, partial [Polyplosphaeria fusca]
MTATSTRIAQTSHEVKKQYKQNGPRLPEHMLRQLQRDAELDRRADKSRALEERRKSVKKKREEKEQKDREYREQAGIGLATQLIGFSHSQAQMKGVMETFLGFARTNRNNQPVQKEVAREPWDESDDDDILADLPATKQSSGDWHDDDLDDDALADMYEVAMSDTAEPPKKPPLPQSTPDEDAEYMRLHGPFNKAIEDILQALPGPLIELLSQDISLNLASWNPDQSLLHRLNPIGVPPHRLRIKSDCVVTLLRDLDTSSQLSSSSHLRVLKFERARLECLVLDGQLKGTKTFITRVPFTANYRNEDGRPFQRMQFPVRVSTDFKLVNSPKKVAETAFKLPCISGQPRSTARKLVRTNSRSKSNSDPNPSFKLPGLPASKSKPITTLADPAHSPDEWDDLFDSGTQIARELRSDGSKNTVPGQKAATSLTQDFNFSLEDWDEDIDDCFDAAILLDGIADEDLQFIESPEPLEPPAKPTKPSTPLPKVTQPPPRPHTQPKLKRKGLSPVAQSAAKRAAPERRAIPKPSLPVLHTCGSFSEFGFSTQDVTSLLDDDESLMFSSPEIAA